MKQTFAVAISKNNVGCVMRLISRKMEKIYLQLIQISIYYIISVMY